MNSTERLPSSTRSRAHTWRRAVASGRRAGGVVGWMAVALVAAGPATAAPLSGRYTSPVGQLQITEKAGEVTGKIVDAANPCGFPKGAVVLQGSRLDDSLVGTLRLCKLGEGCRGEVRGEPMLLISRHGAQLQGVVHVDAGACKTPLVGDSIVLMRDAAAKPKPKPMAPTPAAAPRESARQRAEKLASEAAALLNQSEGNAEAARAKLLEAIEVDPTYPEGHIGVGATYYVRDRYDEALTWYKKALEINPAVADAYYNIGCTYALKGETEQALRYLRIALLNGYVHLSTLGEDPDLKGLAGNPVFEKLKQGIIE